MIADAKRSYVLLSLTVALTVGLVVGAGAVNAEETGHQHYHYSHYDHWKQPGTDLSCCNVRIIFNGEEVGDCEPTPAERRAGAWWAWLRQEGRWIEIPHERMIRERNPSGQEAHLCWSYGRVLCFVPPDTGG
jgi:hypothetical protein